MTLQQEDRGLRTRGARRIGALTLAAVLMASGGAVATAMPAAAADCSSVPWMDTSKTPAERAQSLLAASTPQQEYRWLVEQPANSPQQTTFAGGVTYPVQVDCTPTVIYTDGPDGVRSTAGVTAFPAPLAYAATWNLDLNKERSAAIASEA